MERKPLFRDRQEVTPDDLNNIGLFAEASSDHIVADAIEAGRKFTGAVVTQTSATTITVAPLRLYYDGKRYIRDEAAGVPIDLNSLRPNLQSKIVAIVVWPKDIETDVEQRNFLVDADTLTYSSTAVTMEALRQAQVEAVGGAEAVAPTAPVIDTTSVIVATVLMDPNGIVSITRNDAAVLPNLSSVADNVADLQASDDEIRPQVQTLRSDLARLSSDFASSGNKDLLLSIAADTALIKARLDIPDTYVGYRGVPFLDETSSDPAFAGYAARIEEGLRFPFAAQVETELALLNPNVPGVRLTAAGLLMPASTDIERRITKGEDGTLSLADYSNLDNRTLLQLTMSRSRIRYGADFDVSTGSAFWNSGTYTDRLNQGIRSVFEKDGEQFQVYDTGQVDADGHAIVRLSQFWTDAVASPYWSRLTTGANVLGYAHIETFLNPQDAWITALGPHMTGKPADGTLTIGICETDRGQPNMDRILAMTTVNAADVKLVGDPGNPPKFPIEPTFLQGGQRYGYFIVTQYGFTIGVADAENAADQGVTGTYYYGMNGGTWFANPDIHLIWRDWRASFAKSTVDVDLQALQLAGGVQGIDILADSVVPGSTDLVWSVQVGGFWKPLGDADPSVLAAQNPLLPLRVTFVGTPDVMPAIRMTGSRARVSRLATALKHVTLAKALETNTSSIVEKYRLRGYDPAHHTFTPTVRRADGTIETADTLTSVTQPDGVIEKTATFNLGAPTNSFRSILDATTDSVAFPFSVAELIEIAN